VNFDNFYLLLPAFDRLGRHIYGNQWQGDEARAPERKLPEEISADREPTEDKLLRIAERLSAITARIARTIDDAEIASLKEERAALYDSQGKLHGRLRELPEPRDSDLARYALYDRRRRTEAALRQGLEDGEISAHFGSELMLEWRAWSKLAGFKLIIPLSLAYVPKTCSNARRNFVAFERLAFDKWLGTVTPIIGAEQTITREDQLIRFLREEMKQGKRFSRTIYLQQAQDLIAGLSERTFNRIWADTVPADWTRKGRPPSGKN